MRLVFQVLLILLVAGCVSRRNSELLEARLREQEDELRSLHAQVQQSQADLTAARRLNESLKQKLVQPASHDETFSLDERPFRVTGLKINSLLTGGVDRDGQPGDDQLTLVFAPVDRNGKPLQLLGQVDCELLERAEAAEPRRIARWSFDAAKTAAAWQKTLGSDGYRFELPWQTPPTSRELDLRVRFSAQQGDHFEAATSIQIELPPSALGAGRPMP
jgi:outer membrane murein-binding lipoprotein Lpp